MLQLLILKTFKGRSYLPSHLKTNNSRRGECNDVFILCVHISHYLFRVHGSDSLVSTGSVLRRGGALHVADYQTKHLLATSPSWNTCQCLRRGVCHGRLRQAITPDSFSSTAIYPNLDLDPVAYRTTVTLSHSSYSSSLT